MAELDFRLLGPVEVYADGVRMDLGAARQRHVLAVLVLHAGEYVSTESLIGQVWGAPAGDVRGGLYTYITRLRNVLRRLEVALVRGPGGYLLELPAEQVDVHRSAELVTQAGMAPRHRRFTLLSQALDLWRGEPLADLTGDWVTTTRDVLNRRRLDLLTEWGEAGLAVGHAAEVAARLQQAIGDFPIAEPLLAQLVSALNRTGRSAQAREYFDAAVVELRERLGTEPGYALQQALNDSDGSRGSASDEQVPLPKPHQLPAVPGGFSGRDQHLRRMTELLETTTSLVLLVTGTAGVGKSALTVFWGHEMAGRFPDGTLHVNLRGYGDVEPLSSVEALSIFLRSLGVTAREIPLDENAAAGLYRSLLADRRVLVVLDNAATVEQVRPLLPGAPGSAIVITSRDQLTALVVEEGAKQVRLDGLDRTESAAVLAASLGANRLTAEPIARDGLIDLCAGLPLALRIAAANLLDNPDHALTDYVAELSAERPLDALRIHGSGLAVRGAFDLSYQRLDSAQRRLFRLLSWYPGPDFTVQAALGLIGGDLVRAQRLLGQLAGKHLLERRRHDRYAFHDLLRQYAKERSVAEDADRAAATKRLSSYYLRCADHATRMAAPAQAPLPVPDEPADAWTPPDEAAALAWLDAEWRSLVAFAENAADGAHPECAWLLSGMLRGYLQMRSLHVGWLTVAEAGIAVAQRFGDARGRAFAQLSRGGLARVRGDNEAAIAAYTLAEAHAEEAGWRAGQAAVLTQLGWLYPRLGRFTEAFDCLHRAVELARSIPDPAIECTALGNLGVAHRLTGNLAASLTHLRKEFALLRRSPSPYREANALSDIGVTLHELGKLDEAIARHRESVRLSERIGHDLLGATGRVHLGCALLERGEVAAAARESTQALAAGQRLHLAGVRAGALSILAAVTALRGQSDRARELHRQALLSTVDRRNVLDTVTVHTRGAELTETVYAAVEALELSRRHGFRIAEARALLALARARLRLGDLTAAAEHTTSSLDICQDTGFRPGHAKALLVRADVARARGEPARADADLRAAREMLHEMGMPEPT